MKPSLARSKRASVPDKGDGQMFMISVIAVAVAFLAGVIAGVLALLRVGIACEESAKSIRGEPPTRAAAVTRRVVGLHVRMGRRATQPDHVADRADASQSERSLADAPCR